MFSVWLLAACAAEPPQREASPSPETPATPQAPQPETPRAPARPTFCARAGDDAVRDVFCASQEPAIGSLTEFQDVFGVNPQNDIESGVPYVSLENGEIALLGHSTALPGHLISPLNPRAIMIGQRVLVAYQRGVQRIEIATLDRNESVYNFYLLSFQQACNTSDAGCSPGDLYTPRIESDWTAVRIQDAEDLKNTPSDCRQCHQRAREQPSLLMRELEAPWTHFMFPIDHRGPLPGVSGGDLTKDYVDAKGDELYGGIAVPGVSSISAFKLEGFVGRDQPLLFDGPRIEDERWPWSPSGYPSTPGPSPTWEKAYQAFKRGEQLAVPYLEQRVADPDKQAAIASAYRQYLAGELHADDLPDFADIYPDDPYVRARIGLQTEPDATPEDALIQACGSCHNDVLDQTVTRARFNIAVGRMDRAELNVAIDRLQRPKDAPGAMPPPEFRQLPADVRDRLVEYLKGDLEDVDPRLETAAQLGMAGGGR
ncbi:MAG TPA: hypothetical protein VJR89_17195 [Polyangiales bacterium]|nr:hypothetical protein [Polyangiales bacterium]